MKNFVVNQFRGWLLSFLAVGVIMLFVSPFMWLSMRPGDDFRFHLGKPELHTLVPQDGTGFEHNNLVELSGRIRPKTFMMNRKGMLDGTLDFKFQVEGFPENLVVHLQDGEVYEQLVAAHEADRAKVPALTPEEEGKAAADAVFGDLEFDVEGPELSKVLAQEHSFKGRLYRSDRGLGGEFVAYAGKSDGRIAEYFNHVLNYSASENLAFLVAAEEVPNGVEGVIDGNAGTFLVGIILGIIGIFVLPLFAKDKKG